MTVTRRGRGRSEVQDIKFRSELFEKWAHLKPRLRAACDYARREGKIYRLRSEVEIRTSFLPQAKFLYGFLRQVTPSNQVSAPLLACLKDRGVTTVRDLLAACFPVEAHAEAIPTLWYLVGKREIGADLNLTLTMSTLVCAADK